MTPKTKAAASIANSIVQNIPTLNT